MAWWAADARGLPTESVTCTLIRSSDAPFPAPSEERFYSTSRSQRGATYDQARLTCSYALGLLARTTKQSPASAEHCRTPRMVSCQPVADSDRRGDTDRLCDLDMKHVRFWVL